MKRLLVYMLTGLAMATTSCSDFLDTVPHDVLPPVATWKTEDDAQQFVVGCYNGWQSGTNLLYWDCASDIAFNNFPWEGWTDMGNGSMTPANYGTSFYDFKNIRRCNNFLENVDKIEEFSSEGVKKDLVAQVRAMRAFDYFQMSFWYGDVPIIGSYTSADEAKVPRDPASKVKQFVYDELDAALQDINLVPSARGRVAKGVALAIKMRSALYWGDLERARDAAKAIIDLKQYELEPNYSDLFTLSGQGSKEIILSAQYLENMKDLDLTVIGQMYNNADGGWSSIVPTQNLVDMYEMNDGLTKEESKTFDPVHPFANRDPRMAMTVLFPGQTWKPKGKAETVFNTLDQKIGEDGNKNYPLVADNASKSALTWAKYLTPMDQYNDIWSTSCCPIVFRYAEVLLTYAEAVNELSSPTAEIYDMLDQIRTRAGMPVVDRAKYASKEKLRELIRRERAVELAGEGLRRADIVRWKDANGKMVAETVMNGTLTRVVGTINYAEKDPFMRAVINVNAPLSDRKIEDRKFAAYNRYLPIPQDSRDKNPQLTQNDGY